MKTQTNAMTSGHYSSEASLRGKCCDVLLRLSNVIDNLFSRRGFPDSAEYNNIKRQDELLFFALRKSSFLYALRNYATTKKSYANGRVDGLVILKAGPDLRDKKVGIFPRVHYFLGRIF